MSSVFKRQLVGIRCVNPILSTTACRCFTATTTMSVAERSVADINSNPAADQNIFHDGKEYTTIKEGLAYILVPASAPKIPQTTPRGENKPQDVFYNPIQQFNRDLSVLAIKAYGEDVLEQRRGRQDEIRKKLAQKKHDKNRKRKRGQDGVDAEDARNAGRPERSITDEVTEATMTADSNNQDLVQADSSTVKPTTPEPSGLDSNSRSSEVPAVSLSNVTDDASIATPNAYSAAPEASSGNSKASMQIPPPKRNAFTILDALSATGLRALRYSHEIPFTTLVTANDLLPEATKAINLNIKHNKLEHKITATTSNAMSHMYALLDDSTRDAKNHPQWSRKYNVIDLDPYGTAAPFIDAAVQAVRDDGGLLCVTCTDAGVWASNGYPEKCFALYGGTPIKGQHSHEGGLRLILHAIATIAARYGLAMAPLLSLSIDFYARVFVRIHRSPAEVKFLAGKTMMVYNCDSGCGAWTTQPVARNKMAKSKKGSEIWKHTFAQGPTASEKCPHCGYRMHVAGPMYAGPLHEPTFIKRILDDLPRVDREIYKTTTRIEGMLTLALEECLSAIDSPASADEPAQESAENRMAALDPAPFHFLPSALSKVIHCITPVENAIRGALRGLGYRVTRSHTKAGSIKTDAPWDIIWEVMREWVKQKSPVKEGAVRQGTAGWEILGLGSKDYKKINGAGQTEDLSLLAADKEMVEGVGDAEADDKLNIVFDESLGKEKDTKKLVRYQLNPRENWGPMARAKGKP